MTDKKEIRLSVRYFNEVTRDFIDYYSERDLKKREAMDKPDYGGYESLSGTGGPFICSIDGNAIEAERYVFMVYFLPDEKRLQVQALIGAEHSPIITEPAPEEYRGKKGFADEWFRYADDFKPIAEALTTYPLTAKNLKQFNRMMPRTVDPGINEAFGSLLKAILEGAGYVVTIVVKPSKVEYFYASTTDHVVQRGFSADKRGNFLTDLLNVGNRAGISTATLYDNEGINIIGLKIDISIPSEKAVNKQVQLKLDFDFQRDGGFRIIPISEISEPETKKKLENILQDIEEKISKELDPLALRVKDATLCLSQEKYSTKFDCTEDELLDMLYKKVRKGKGLYHHPKNKQRLRDRLLLISKIKLSYAIKVGNNVIGVEDIPYIILNPEGKPFVEVYSTATGKPKRRYNFQSIQIPDRYYDLLCKQYVGQFHKKSLLLQGAKYSLYKYIATWWRIEWLKKKGVYKWFLVDILRGAGITPPDKTHAPRFFKNLNSWLDEMVAEGLLGSYRRLNKQKDPLLDTWQFVAPKEIKDRYKNIGDEYQKSQEIKALRSEKKRLTLEADVTRLKKGAGDDI